MRDFHRMEIALTIRSVDPIRLLNLTVSLVHSRAINTISIYWRCINSVNQVSPKRGNGISIAFAIRSFDSRLRRKWMI